LSGDYHGRLKMGIPVPTIHSGFKLYLGDLYLRDRARGDLLLSAKERQLKVACGAVSGFVG